MAIHLKKMRYDFACPGLPARQATPHKAERFPISNRPVRHSLGDGGIGVDWKKIFFILFMASSIAPQVGAMEQNKPTPKFLDRLLLHAAEMGNVYEIERVLELGANIEARDHDDKTPLICAVSKAHQEAVEYLLNNGADPNAITAGKNTALTYGMDGTSDDRIAIYKLLLKHGAQVNFQNEIGATALFYNAHKYPAVCSFLMWHGADPTIRFDNDLTPLMKSAMSYGGKYATYIPILQTQYQINRTMEVTLLCLNRIKRDMIQPEKIRICASELYRNFQKLLRPYMGNYIPLKQLLNMKDDSQGKRAYDYLQNDWLNPDTVYDALEKSQNGWFSNCSIQ